MYIGTNNSYYRAPGISYGHAGCVNVSLRRVSIGHFNFSQSKRDKNHELWTIQAGHSNGPTAGEADAVSVSSTVNSAYQQ